jgi:hypothetical protein
MPTSHVDHLFLRSTTSSVAAPRGGPAAGGWQFGQFARFERRARPGGAILELGRRPPQV